MKLNVVFKCRKEKRKWKFVIWFCHSLSSLTPNWLLSLSFSDHITSYNNTCTHNTHTFIHITEVFLLFFRHSQSHFPLHSSDRSLLHTQGTFPSLFLSFCQIQNYFLDHTLDSYTPLIIIHFLMLKNWTLPLTNNGFCFVVLCWVWSHSATELVACKRFFFVFFIFNPSCVLQFVYWKIMSWILGILYKEKYIFCSSCHLSLNWSFWVCVFIYFHFWH